MKTMTRTSKLGTLVFVSALAAGWIGCAVDATPPDKGPEPVAKTSSALTPPPPFCGPGGTPTTTVKAFRHTTSYNPSFSPSPYAVSAHYGGQSSAGYSMPCGTPIGDATGYMVSCGSDPNVYEEDLWGQAYRSNGYAYWVSVPLPFGSRMFVGVGINSSTASPAWSYTPPPPPGHPAGGSPTTADWDAELNLVSTAPGTDGDVQARYLPCVQVVAADTGQVLDFFPLMDFHDPEFPPW
jgi:hypothetical protein